MRKRLLKREVGVYNREVKCSRRRWLVEKTNVRTYHEGFLIVGYQVLTSSLIEIPMRLPPISGTPMLAIRDKELPMIED
jgi:hypothetical protein